MVLAVEHLTVNYEEHAVLWDVSLEIPHGKMVGVIGPNGAGKSTFLKALLHMVEPVSGMIAFWGEPFKKVCKRIAYVPQRTSVDWDFPVTVFDVVLMGRYGRLGWLRRPKAADKAAARAALEKVGMLSFAERQISQLSGGQQQRVFIARALLQEAEIYFLDEPFVGIDHATESLLIALFDKMKGEGKTLFIVHHDLNSASRYFDWMVLLNTALVASGPTEQVFTEENIRRAYGSSAALLGEVAKLTQHKTKGLSS